MVTFFISIIADLMNALFFLFPNFYPIVSSFVSGFVSVVQLALQYEFIVPVREVLSLLVFWVQFQSAFLLALIVRFVILLFVEAF